MPSRPSSPPERTREVISTNVLELAGFAPLNSFTAPPCSTTYQRALSFGACNIASGEVNESAVNRLKEISLPTLGRGHATHVAFAGRVSSPLLGLAGGGSVLGGVPRTTGAPLSQPATSNNDHAMTASLFICQFVLFQWVQLSRNDDAVSWGAAMIGYRTLDGSMRIPDIERESHWSRAPA
jgi:hypothetical protein